MQQAGIVETRRTFLSNAVVVSVSSISTLLFVTAVTLQLYLAKLCMTFLSFRSDQTYS